MGTDPIMVEIVYLREFSGRVHLPADMRLGGKMEEPPQSVDRFVERTPKPAGPERAGGGLVDEGIAAERNSDLAK